MAQVSFTVSDENARKINGLFQNGRKGQITFWVYNRQVVMVVTGDVWPNGTEDILTAGLTRV